MTVSGLPPIDPTFEPPSVRNGSPAVQKAYASALDFESMLVQQLSQSLSETSGLGGEGESGSTGEGGSEGGGSSDPGSAQLSSLLPQTLTNSVMSHGGLGMAQQLMGTLLPAGEAATQSAAVGAPTASNGAAPGAGAVTVGGGSLANAPVGGAGSTSQVDPTGGVQA